MNRSNFIRFASIAFGLLALIAASAALRVAWHYAGNLGDDIVRFCTIALSAILGVVFLRARRTADTLRRIATRSGTGPPRFACAMVMSVPALVAMLSGAVPFWLILGVFAAHLIAFVYPGWVFQGVIVDPSPQLSPQELGALARPFVRRSKAFFAFYIAMIALFVLSLASFILVPSTIPSAGWKPLVVWTAPLLALVSVGALTWPLYLVMPKEARPKTLPGVAMVALFFILVGMFTYRALLLDAVPTIAAKLGGTEVARAYPVLRVEPNKSRKGCRGAFTIGTQAWRLQLCNFKRDVLDALIGRDSVMIKGKATWLGQTVETLQIRL